MSNVNLQSSPVFDGDDNAENNSIGSGTSDQGMDAEDQPKEDEFGDVNAASPDKGFAEAANDDGSWRGNSGDAIGALSGKYDQDSSSAEGSGTIEKGFKQPDHGLVEEGPGPDA